MTQKTAASDELPEQFDGYLKRSEVERITGYSCRTLKRRIAAGVFPPPDIPGGNGAGACWRRSTVSRALDALAIPPPKRAAAP